MSIASFIQRCLDAGMPMDMVLKAVAAFEAEMPVYVPPERTKGAERAARYRANKRDGVTETVTDRDDVTLSVTKRDEVTAEAKVPLSPTPPNPSKITPPFTPLKGGVSLPCAKADDDGLKAVSEEIWNLQPLVGGKRRATRPDVLKALRAAVDRRNRDPLRIVEACRAYYRLPDCRKDGGQFAMGAAVLLAEDRWQEFEPQQARPPPKPEPAVYAAHVRHFHDTGEWKPSWGEKPNIESAA